MKFIEEPNRIYIVTDDDKFVGEITYQTAGEDMYIIDHTLVEMNFRGRGLAEELVKKVVDKAIAENKKIVPLCPFAKAEFDRKPEYQKIQHGM